MTLALAPLPVDAPPREVSRADVLEELWQRHGGCAYALACALLGNQAAASDVVRLAMADLGESSARDLAPGEARRSLAQHVYRRALVFGGSRPATAELPTMMWAISRLARLQRESLALCFYGGLTHREAAALLDVAPGTVAVLLNQALREVAQLVRAPAGARG